MSYFSTSLKLDNSRRQKRHVIHYTGVVMGLVMTFAHRHNFLLLAVQNFLLREKRGFFLFFLKSTKYYLKITWCINNKICRNI